MPSPINTARKLLENKLKTITPSIQIAFENVSFTPPIDKYLRATLSIKKPTNDSIGNNCYLENLSFNVFVCDKLNIGSGGAYETAEAIRALFLRGSTLEEGNIRLLFKDVSHIQNAIPTTDRLVVPVIIPVTVEILS